MTYGSKTKVEIRLNLPNLGVAPEDDQLSQQDRRIIKSAQEKATSNVFIFVKLLESAELEHGETLSQRVSKVLLLLLRRRKSVVIHVFDPESGARFDMNFSLPVRLLGMLLDTPIAQLLETDSLELAREGRVPVMLLNRLKDDLRVFKIVSVYKGEFSSDTRLADFT